MFLPSQLNRIAGITVEQTKEEVCRNLWSRVKMLSLDLVFEDIIESDVELDNSELVEPDYDPPQEMGDPSIEVTDENRETSQALKEMAMYANLEEKLEEAIHFLTKAIMLNPKSSMLFSSRASVFVKLQKPNAAIRDADVALKMNDDSAKGYKARGMAKAQLGLWEEAFKDLRRASRLDFDEETVMILRKVETNTKKIEEHRRKYEHLRKENELRKKRRQEDEAAAAILKDGEVIEINSRIELDEKLNAASKLSRLSVMHFTAKWCKPSEYLSPAFSRLAEKYSKVVFLKVYIDEAMDAAKEWNVSSVPCFFFVKRGKEVDKIVDNLHKLVRVNKNPIEVKIDQHTTEILT